MKYVLYSGHPVVGGFFAGLRVETVNGAPIVAARAYRHLGAADVMTFESEEEALRTLRTPYRLLDCQDDPGSEQARVFGGWAVLAVSDDQYAVARADWIAKEKEAWA